MDEQRQQNYSVYSFLRQVLKPYFWYLLGWVLVSVAWALDAAIRPYILRIITNRASGCMPGSLPVDFFYPVLWYSVLTVISSVFITRLYNWISLKASPELKKYIAKLMVEYIIRSPNEVLQNQLTGSVTNRINDVVNGTPALVTDAIDGLLFNSLTQLTTIITVWQVSYKYSLVIFAWIIIVLAMTVTSFQRSKKLSSDTYEEWSGVVGRMVNILSNIMSIRFFTIRRHETGRFNVALEQALAREEQKNIFFLGLYNKQSISFVVLQSICLWMLVSGMKTGATTAGDFALILTVNTTVSDALSNLSTAYLAFSENLGKVTQGLKITDSPIKLESSPKTVPLQASSGRIVFENVSFHYRGTPQLFYDKTLIIESGQKIALVGRTGNGRSSFINLLLGVFKLKGGKILIDGQDISMATTESISAAIAVIPQDPPFFHQSVKENIRYAKRNATDEKIIAAATKAQAHEFIMSLPSGYDTWIGNKETKLRGSEKRLISIARAFLKDSPIVILDGVTNGFDIEMESKIQANFWTHMEGKTVIIIAHRLVSLVSVDKILVFEQGKVVQEGTHSELVAQDGVYQSIWESQNKIFF